MKNISSILIISLILPISLFAQEPDRLDQAIDFPDIPGYKTLKCEFHQHTVFSDGAVWPSIRVAEAVRFGLDAMSITDHLEYQPHENEVPNKDKNFVYESALRDATANDILLINGAEITRGMAPGHLNAIFIQDANKLLIDDPTDAIREANKQGGFVFWNHPHWTAQKSDGVAELTQMHKELIKEGLIQGIEIVNSSTYSDEAFQIALDNNLTILGNTDVHGIVEWDPFITENHRTATLVFATEKTNEALKEAIVKRRTAVWFNNTLFGSSELLTPLVESSLIISDINYRGNSSVLSFYVENVSDANYVLENLSKYRLHTHASVLTIKAHHKTKIELRTLERLDNIKVDFKVLNAFISPDEHPEISFSLNTR